MSSPLRLSEEDFKKSLELVPRAAISLLIINPEGKFLLVKRSYPPFEGEWYLPGSFIMKNETFLECITRVAKDELGISVKPEDAKSLGIFETLHDDARGHALDMLYEIRLNDEELSRLKPTEEPGFFDMIPALTYSGHKKSLLTLGYR